MSKKQLLFIIASLIVINIVTIFFATKPFSTGIFGSNDGSKVASVGKISIDREQLRAELEKRYGNEVLRDLIDEEVIKQTAKKYNIEVSDKELERELAFINGKYGSFDQQYLQDKDNWEEKIRNNILLEKLLVHNVNIAESEVEAVYENNRDDYKVPTAYHLSHIVVKKKKEAQQIYEDLKEDTPFSILAMEKSIDDSTATQDGDIGYITKEHKRYPKAYIEKASEMKVNSWSKPIKVEDGYAIIYLHERFKGKTYDYDEVKSMIERQLALGEMNGSITADYFWEESNVEWLYEKE